MANLSLTEQKRLAALEKIVEKGLAESQRALLALEEIRDKRLYRADFGTFEDYCREQWCKTPQHINRKLALLGLNRVLEPIGSKLASEGQARAVAQMVLSGKPTAAKLVAALKDMSDDDKLKTIKAAEEAYRQRPQVFGGIDEEAVLGQAVKALGMARKKLNRLGEPFADLVETVDGMIRDAQARGVTERLAAASAP